MVMCEDLDYELAKTEDLNPVAEHVGGSAINHRDNTRMETKVIALASSLIDYSGKI